MTPELFAWIAEAAKNVTVVGLLLFFVYGGFKEWWVFGKDYRIVRNERDKFMEMLFTSLGATRESAVAAQRAVSLAEKTGSKRHDGA